MSVNFPGFWLEQDGVEDSSNKGGEDWGDWEGVWRVWDPGFRWGFVHQGEKECAVCADSGCCPTEYEHPTLIKNPKPKQNHSRHIERELLPTLTKTPVLVQLVQSHRNQSGLLLPKKRLQHESQTFVLYCTSGLLDLDWVRLWDANVGDRREGSISDAFVCAYCVSQK